MIITQKGYAPRAWITRQAVLCTTSAAYACLTCFKCIYIHTNAGMHTHTQHGLIQGEAIYTYIYTIHEFTHTHICGVIQADDPMDNIHISAKHKKMGVKLKETKQDDNRLLVSTQIRDTHTHTVYILYIHACTWCSKSWTLTYSASNHSKHKIRRWEKQQH